MEIPKNIESLISGEPGKVVTIRTSRQLKVRKEFDGIEVVKNSKFTVKLGIDYETIEGVPSIEKRKEMAKNPDNVGKLPWGTWVRFPYIIEHKGQLYLRCTKIPDILPEVSYWIDVVVEISKDQAKEYCLASEFRQYDDSPVFNVKVSDILSAE